MKTADALSLTHERVDDIPLLLGFMQELKFPDLLERHLGSHHLHRGLSNGWLATVWLAFLLSQSNHRKVSVQDWAGNHPHTLETLIGQTLRPIEFADDRLSIVLRRLHDADWSALEADLWQATCEVYDISYQCVRLDSTTSFGYHTITPDGLMQRGQGAFRFCRRKVVWKKTFESTIRAVLFHPGGKEFHHALCYGRRLEGGPEDSRNRGGVARGKSEIGAMAGGRRRAEGRLGTGATRAGRQGVDRPAASLGHRAGIAAGPGRPGVA